MKVTLGRSQDIRNRADAPSILVKNRFFEENPQNTDDQVSFIERPALIVLKDMGDGNPGRRLFRQKGFANGDVFHVAGNNLYRHTQSPARVVTTTQISGVIQGTGAPDMCATNGYLFITDGYSLQYTDGTAALQTISTANINNVTFASLDVFHGYVMATVGTSDRFYWLQPGALTFNALDFATAESYPDKILQVRVVGDEFWLLGESSIEVWRATGDGNAPFERAIGRAFNFGIYSGTAVRMKDTSVTLVANDGTVFSIYGMPKIVSDPAIAEKTRDAIRIANGG